MKILVLEDDPVSMKKLSHDLAGFGHDVLEAADSVEALNLYYDNSDIDLIVTDLAMPFGSGEDFIRDMKSLNPKIPVIVVSGTVSKKSLASLKKYKIKGILVKPHNKERLKDLIDAL